MKIFIEIFAVLCMISATVTLAKSGGSAAAQLDQYATDPLNATYLIEGRAVHLIDGSREVAAALGSATKIRTAVLGQPVYGDMDGDGDKDAALLLTHDPGGSGTFYYVAAAISLNGRYQATNTVLLGDRIAPMDITIRSGTVVVKFADRRLEEPMSTAPSVNKSTVLILKNEKLVKIRQFGEGDQIFEGWVTIGHEVRSFLPCSYKKTLWLMGNSPALDEIIAAYGKALPGAMPYTPIFMTLAGRAGKPSADGFGADYEGAFLAKRLVQVFPQGNCKSDLIYVESPLPGECVTSPLRIRGYARGKWFFEGDFPIVLRASSGKVVATGYATAKDEWMTDNFVPFESEIKFKMPKPGSRGTLILKKDNPTDLPEHDDELEIVIYFEYQDSMGADPWQKITFDIAKLDESGLYGPPDGKRALSYEFCIPDTEQHRTEVKRIDPTVKFFAESPGRIGCGKHENLCIGSTHQKDFRMILQRLAELTYVQRIDESFFE